MKHSTKLIARIPLAITGYAMFFCWSKDFVEHGYGYIPFVILIISVILTMLIGYELKQKISGVVQKDDPKDGGGEY